MLKSLKSKLIFLVALFILFFIALITYNRYETTEEADSLFKIRVDEKNKLFDKLISLKGNSMELFAYDYTYWDEMVNFVTADKVNKEWAYDNLESVLQSFQVNYVWVYKKDFSLFYSCGNIMDSSIIISPFNDNQLKNIFSKNHFSHFFIRSDSGIVEIRTAPIQPSNDLNRTTTPQGYFITGKLWDKKYVNDLSQILEGNLCVLPYSESKIDLSEGILTSDTLIVKRTLYDWKDYPVSQLKFALEKDFYKEELQSYFRKEYYIFIIFMTLLLSVSVLIFANWFSNPLKRIFKSLETADLSHIESLKNNRTELGKLANILFEHKNDEIRLKKSEEKYRAFIYQSLEAIWRIEFETPISIHLTEEEQISEMFRTAFIAECNDAKAKIYGYRKSEELVGKKISEILIPSDEVNINFIVNFIRSGLKLTEAETHGIDLNGNIKYVLNNVVGVIENDCVVRVWGTSMDITDKKLTKEH